MRNKFIPLIVALVFGSVAAVGFTKMMKASPQAETIEIFVAVRDIDVAEELTQESIRLAHWPASTVPRDAIQDWKAMEGKFASQRLFAEEPIVLRKLMDSKDSKTVDIPKGFNVVTLKTDEASSVANLVSPGDRVNVIGFFTKSDVIPSTTTRTVLSGVKVFAVDGRTSREENGDAAERAARTVSLLIHAGDAEAWTCAKEMGKISLSLGRPDDNASDADAPNVAGQQFLEWLAAHQDAKARKERAVMPMPQPTASAIGPDPASLVVPAAEVSPQVVEHRMVKIGADGQMQVYTWLEGNPIPQVSGSGQASSASSRQHSSPESPTPQSPTPQSPTPQSPTPESPTIDPATTDAPTPSLDFLHGEKSPLYSDPKELPTS